MRLKRPIALTALMLLGLLGTGTTADQDANRKTPDSVKEIHWQEFSDSVIKLAANEEKHIFIDFTASWCGWCKKMDKEAFADSTVISLLNNHFVPVKVWGDSKKMLDIDGYQITEEMLSAREFGVQGYPTFWFMTPDGKKLAPLRGYVETKPLIEVLTLVKDFAYDSTRAKTGNKQNP